MDNSKVLDPLVQVFRSVFDDPTLQISDTMTAKDVDGWDSLNHINLIVSVEKEFGIKFTTKEIMLFRNVGDFARSIEAKLAAKS